MSPPNPDHLLRVCTILYQQQDSPDPRLHSKLHASCLPFPYSWQLVYGFFQYTEANTTSHFTHISVSFNKLLDVIGESRNIELFWELLHETGRRHLVNDKTFRIALNTLAAAKELKKCVEFFHSLNANDENNEDRQLGLSTYRLAIEWICKRSKNAQACIMFEEMRERGIQVDNLTLASLIYGLLVRGRVREAYRIVAEIEKPDVNVYHGLTKGFLKLRRASEATQIIPKI
ncbi:putative pentatricopeptide repeat-containing protein [Quercus suber]|uniref:Pentatricopeptide repeat-containing protein n=1 Tax=Quercus suber TaxID=58331 RepID=A0AAW0KI96_QUESU